MILTNCGYITFKPISFKPRMRVCPRRIRQSRNQTKNKGIRRSRGRKGKFKGCPFHHFGHNLAKLLSL